MAEILLLAGLLFVAAAALRLLRYMWMSLYRLSPEDLMHRPGVPDPQKFRWSRNLQDYLTLLSGKATIVVHWEDTEPTRYEIVGNYMFNLITVRGDANMEFHVDIECCDPWSVQSIGDDASSDTLAEYWKKLGDYYDAIQERRA